MSTKQIIFNEQVWEKLITGADILTKAVGATLGPNGRTVIIQSQFGEPKITKDGVSVAREISVEDAFEDLAVKALVGVANRMSVGDGTTSSIVFSHALLTESRKLIAAGINPNQIIKDIELGAKNVLEIIAQNTQLIADDLKMIERVATISANGDEQIGQIIADAYKQVGKNGVITVEESKTGETEVSVINGMKLDKGYCSPYFITNAEKSLCELQNPLILIYDGKISTVAQILTLLEEIAKQGRALLIVADEVDGEALTALVINKMRGKLKVAAIKGPSFGDRRKEILQDLSVLTGGTLISSETGDILQDIGMSNLGTADKVTISKDSTIITGGQHDQAQLNTRLSQLQASLLEASSEYDRNKLTERIAHLSKGVAVIKVGGHSSLAIGELKDRVDDAVSSVKAAAEKGIVPGGGALFVHAAKKLADTIVTGNNPGFQVLERALLAIAYRIALNSGIEHAHSIVKQISDNDNFAFGYDAKQDRFGNMKEFGIVDAALVQELIVKNGVDGVKTLINACVMIVNAPEKDKEMGGMNPGMGMM